MQIEKYCVTYAFIVRRISRLSTVCIMALLSACASRGVVPTAELATAQTSITRAESAGASSLATVDLLAARNLLREAEASVDAKQFEQARRYAIQSETQSEIAERKARVKKAQVAALELERSNMLLREELERNRRQSPP